MKVRISIEQTVDVDEILFHNEEFDMANNPDISMDTKIDYLVARFCEDIDNLVKHDMVSDQILVEYIED